MIGAPISRPIGDPFHEHRIERPPAPVVSPGREQQKGGEKDSERGADEHHDERPK